MNRFHRWTFALAAVPFALATSIGAASPPLPDPAWGGSGDGIAITRSVLPPFVDGFDHRPAPPVPSRGDERNPRELPKAKERTP
jgi:hypothetical protein